MGTKYCGNSQVQDRGGEEKGKHHFHHFVVSSIWSAEISESFNGSKLGLRPSTKAVKAMIKSLFEFN